MICQATPCFRASAKAVFTTALLLVCASVRADSPSPDKLLKEGDAHDTKLEAAEALASYLELEKLEPTNADVMVRIARQYRHLMADTPDTNEKLKLGNMALAYGKRAAALAPNNSDAQLSCAISYGKMIPLQSSKEQVACSKLIKEGAEKAIKLNANNDLAWHILGRWNRGVASVGALKRALASVVYERLPTATNEDAVNCFEKAVKLNPGRMMHYIELGRTYAQMSRTEDAKRCLKKGVTLPVVDKEDATMKADGRELLATLR